MKSRIEIKNVLAITLIAAAFLSAFALAFISNNRESYWIATRNLTPGHLVDVTDFKLAKASLAKSAAGYLPGAQSPVGLSLSRFIAAGEYLNLNSLADSNSQIDGIGGFGKVKLLSFAVAMPDLPASIKIGDLVNLYQVINVDGSREMTPSELVIESVYIVDLNRRSENIGGATIVTVAIPNDFVERALDATRQGRMVVVANHG